MPTSASCTREVGRAVSYEYEKDLRCAFSQMEPWVGRYPGPQEDRGGYEDDEDDERVHTRQPEVALAMASFRLQTDPATLHHFWLTAPSTRWHSEL